MLTYGEEPTLEQITEELAKNNVNLPVQKVSDIKKLNIDLISMDKPIAMSETSNLTDFVPDDDTISPQELAIKSHQSQELENFLKETLVEDELVIINMTYGLGNFTCSYTPDQIVSEQLLGGSGTKLIKNKSIKNTIENMIMNQKKMKPEE